MFWSTIFPDLIIFWTKTSKKKPPKVESGLAFYITQFYVCFRFRHTKNTPKKVPIFFRPSGLLNPLYSIGNGSRGEGRGARGILFDGARKVDPSRNERIIARTAHKAKTQRRQIGGRAGVGKPMEGFWMENWWEKLSKLERK